MVKTLFPMQGHGFDPWSGNSDPAYCTVQPKPKRKIEKNYLLFT